MTPRQQHHHHQQDQPWDRCRCVLSIFYRQKFASRVGEGEESGARILYQKRKMHLFQGSALATIHTMDVTSV